MAKLIWTDPALQDVEEIAEYIVLDNIKAAKKLVRKIFEGVTRLEQFPDSGRKLPELKRTIYREILINPCRIIYKVYKDKVYILFVMRMERQLRKYLLDERNTD